MFLATKDSGSTRNQQLHFILGGFFISDLSEQLHHNSATMKIMQSCQMAGDPGRVSTSRTAIGQHLPIRKCIHFFDDFKSYLCRKQFH